MACENNDLASIGGGEPFQCRLQALIIILCKAVVEDQREAGERLAASYINFYLANHCVLLPRFGDENDTVAAEILGKCFPDRRILPVDARVILTGGGNIHCITQQIPAKKRGNRL